MKNKGVNALILASTVSLTIYGILSLWSGLDPMPVAASITFAGLFFFFTAFLWTWEEIRKSR